MLYSKYILQGEVTAMTTFLALAFLFAVGSLCGWGIEVLFRHWFSGSNPEHRWVNPGFLVGPYLPLYGIALCALYLLAGLESVITIETPWLEKLVLFAIMAACVTAIEYFTGLFCIRVLRVRLWDYSKRRGNVQGIICPLFTLFWAVLSALYYFLIHPHIVDALMWLSQNLALSFVIGMFYGIFFVDLGYSIKLLPTIRRFAAEHELVVRFEDLKEDVRSYAEVKTGKAKFFILMHTPRPLVEQLTEYSKKLKELNLKLKHRDDDKTE